jgi:hypothetical protein
MLNSKLVNQKYKQESEMPSLINDARGKVIIHKRITKTFAANTPEQSVDHAKRQEAER